MNEKDFEKIALEWAIIEAERCLYCFDAPCEKACPINLPISNFIYFIKNKNFKSAYELVRENHPLISIAGCVCPEEILCQTECTRGKIDKPIKIRELHKFLTEYFCDNKNLSLPEYKYEEVAIIGGGPASLSCAFYLRTFGYKTVVFSDTELGGIPLKEISNLRLSDETLKRDLDFIKENFIFKFVRKRVENLNEILNSFKAIFIGIGLSDEIELEVLGKDKEGVFKAREILRKIKRGEEIKFGERIGVIGGGNVAFEVANTLKTLYPDKEVIIIYRRGLTDLKCYPEEFERAKKLGVNFYFESIPIEIVGKEKVEGIKVTQVSLKEKDKDGRRVPKLIENSEFIIPLNNIIIAIGQKLEETIFPEIQKENGLIKVDENFMTNIKGVFAGGDCVNGGDTITRAAKEGKLAAFKIHEYLRRI
ncbi:MAG: FAD-dependent oxidoreductase [Caldisericia bacterium]|jgi:NADPH-dependent glutamate synthase beta subunit-like oxidoreductase|nr:FAD-dependent oxidoreductase [Caldisericia bacterium]